jgi:leader peptidase (prepilin peptidase)/N-methyltransferase
MFAWLHYESAQESILFLLFAMPLCMASQTDFESMMLPDSINTLVLFAGLGFAIFHIGHITVEMAFVGAISCFLTLATVRAVGSFVFKREAMGNGDPKFYAAIGAWIGPLNIPHSLLYAALTALIYAMAVKVFTHRQSTENLSSTPIPFGPFLAIGGLICYIWPGWIERFL